MRAQDIPSDDYQDPECERCETPYILREGCDPTPYCDPCAHGVVCEMRAEILRLRGIDYGRSLPDAMELIRALWDAYVTTVDPLDAGAEELRDDLIAFVDGLGAPQTDHDHMCGVELTARGDDIVDAGQCTCRPEPATKPRE